MRESDVRYIVLHCSATRCNTDYTEEMLLRDHLARKFKGIGYHFYIRKDGRRVQGRKLLEVGAHAVPYNRCSIGVCYEGGLDENGRPCNTMTEKQRTELTNLTSCSNHFTNAVLHAKQTSYHSLLARCQVIPTY